MPEQEEMVAFVEQLYALFLEHADRFMQEVTAVWNEAFHSEGE